MVFLRGQQPPETELPFKKPKKNFLALQCVIRMVENVVFLREWIGYHLAFGVDKFFIYDNSNSVKSEFELWDHFVTEKTNKYNMNFACVNKTQEQVAK